MKIPKKAKKYFDESTAQINAGDYQAAIATLQKAVSADNQYIEAWQRIGDLAMLMEDFPLAIKAYKQVIAIDPAFSQKSWIGLGRASIRTGNYYEALKYLDSIGHAIDSTANLYYEWLLLHEKARFAIDAIKHPVPFNPVRLDSPVNTVYSEYFPALTADQKQLVFTREYLVNDYPNEDLFIATKKKGKWRDVTPLSPKINTRENEGAHCLSPDGRYIFLTACQRKNSYGSCDIYIAQKTGNQWSEPYNLGRPVNSPFWESQPSISADGRTLYFCSTRKGGLGGSDIYVTHLLPDGSWSKPQNLGSPVNTPYDEWAPFIHPDNSTLYFSSDGHPGMGGVDIYKAVKNPDGSWSSVQNLGFPINTNRDENGIFVTADGKLAFFSGQSDSTRTQRDIYYFELYPEARPTPVSYVKGMVFDAQTGKPIEAVVNVIALEDSSINYSIYTDPVNGSFLVCLPTGKKYAFYLEHPGYLFYSSHFDLANSDTNNHFIRIGLEKISPGKTIILRNIFFDTDDYRLKKESITELNKIVDFLQKNPSIHIEISGHTDNTGSPSHNLTLSENRAKSIYDYLIHKGISSQRLHYQGYGATKPVADNSTEEGKALNRRAEITIVNMGN